MDPEEGAQDTIESRTEAGSESENEDQPLCAGWISPKDQCEEFARISCEKCHLVAYCSEKCKANDSIHNHASNVLPSYPRLTKYEDGKIPDDPFFETTTFWANYAAFDVLNLAKNEGPGYDGPLHLLLLGPFGLRHLVYSFVAIPETANPLLDVTLLESEMPHLMRTFLSLLVLSEEDVDSFEVAELIVHVWYSAKWPRWIYSYINEHAGHILSDIYRQLESRYENDVDKTECFLLQLGTPGYLTFDVVLDWYTWNDLLDCYYQKPDWGSTARADDVSRCGEPLDRIFRTMSSSRTAALMKWRLDGIVIPYSESSSSYTIPNPAFFLPGTGLPAGITNEPLSEWPMNEILDYSPYPAKEDVYGKMNLYLRKMIVAFRAGLKKRGMMIRVITCGLVEMAGHIPKYQHTETYFDRIEVGNLFDLEPQLCFLSCAPLLRLWYENPCATMLTMSRESVLQAEEPSTRRLIEMEKNYLQHPAFEPLDTVTPRSLAAGEQYSAALLPRHMFLMVFRNWEMFSYKYLSSVERFGFQVPGHGEIPQPRAPVMITGYLGLQLMWENTVVNRWPNLPTHGEVGIPTKEDLMRWMSWPATKPQYLREWRRVREIGAQEWFEHLRMIKGEQVVVIWKRLYGCLGPREEGEAEDERQGGDDAGTNADKKAYEHGNEVADSNDVDGGKCGDAAYKDEHAGV